MVTFNHLHTHSHYSFLEALPSPRQLVDKAISLEMAALGLTEHLSLSGSIEFYITCLESGIKPILGLQLPVASPPELVSPPGELILIAVDLTGWRSLCRLSSAMLCRPTSESMKPLDFNRFSLESNGLICLTGGSLGSPAKLLRKGQERTAEQYLGHLADLFPDRLYVELQHRTPDEGLLSEKLIHVGRKLNLPFVASNDVHYLEPDQVDQQKLLAAMRLNQPVTSLPVGAAPPAGSYFTTPIEMANRFSDLPEALTVTQEIADRCQLQLPLDSPRFPRVPLPPGQSAIQVLREKAEQGARKRYGHIDDRIQTRLDHELAVIEEKDYAPLFIIMEDVLGHARQIGIPISSRGSAASSLVAYCLEITSPDPLKLDLYFERFLNPARATPPDIDTDLSSQRRDEVIDYVYQTFGEEHVAMVATINRFQRRSALRETAKALGFSAQEIKKMADGLPRRWRRPGSGHQESPFVDLLQRFPDQHYQRLFAEAVAMIGQPRHLSIHPGGVVISPGEMTDLVPTQLASKGIVITQFDLESVSRLGLVKIDLLGIRGLSVLGDVAQLLQSRRPDTFPSPLDALEAIPEEDETTAELVRTGRTIGCFQIESPGMRATLKEIQAHSMDDVMIALALYRPGPLVGGLKDSFVRRHRGEEEVSHFHPALSQLLADTYGVILYQEQVLRIAHELAGLSLTDADLLRRAMSHFDPGEQMHTLREKFIRGAWENSQIDEQTAERVWELMTAFAGYGFPKAHAASYAQISWRTAWCKAHEPAAFMAAVMANWGGYYRQRVYLNEARRMGLALFPPEVNFAQRQFSVTYHQDGPALYMGLDQVRELTRRTQDRILEKRPFRSMIDFLTRVDPRPQEADNLIRVGALAEFGSIPDLLLQSEQGGWRGGQLPMFSEPEAHASSVEDWTLEEKLTAQEEILGIGVIAHRLELFTEQINAAGGITTVEAAERLGQRVRVAGVRLTWQQRRSNSGGYIYLMDLEDLEGMLLVVIPEELHRRQRSVFSTTNPFIVEGELRLEGRFNEPAIHAERAWRLA
jgi:DNA-directed DNA polymerase III PolC